MANLRFTFAFAAFFACITATLISFELFLPEQGHQKPPQELQLVDKKSRPSEFFYQVIGNIPTFNSRRSLIHQKDSNERRQQFTLEVDVLESQREAETLLDSLRKDGVVAYYTPIHVGDRVIYRVRKGIYPSKKLASAAKASIASEHGIEARIVELQ